MPTSPKKPLENLRERFSRERIRGRELRVRYQWFLPPTDVDSVGRLACFLHTDEVWWKCDFGKRPKRDEKKGERHITDDDKSAFEAFQSIANDAGQVLLAVPGNLRKQCSISPDVVAAKDDLSRWMKLLFDLANDPPDGLINSGVQISGKQSSGKNPNGQWWVTIADAFLHSGNVVDWLIEQSTREADPAKVSTANGKRCSLKVANTRMNKFISTLKGRKAADGMGQRDLIKKIGCSVGTLGKTDYWRDHRAGKVTPAGSGKRKTVSLTSKLESTIGTEDETLNELLKGNTPEEKSGIMDMLQDADFEPSPFDGSPKKIRHVRK